MNHISRLDFLSISHNLLVKSDKFRHLKCHLLASYGTKFKKKLKWSYRGLTTPGPLFLSIVHGPAGKQKGKHTFLGENSYWAKIWRLFDFFFTKRSVFRPELVCTYENCKKKCQNGQIKGCGLREICNFGPFFTFFLTYTCKKAYKCISIKNVCQPLDSTRSEGQKMYRPLNFLADTKMHLKENQNVVHRICP